MPLLWNDWRAVKQRHFHTESSVDKPSTEEPSPDEEIAIDSVVVTRAHQSLACQTDLTMLDLDKNNEDRK